MPGLIQSKFTTAYEPMIVGTQRARVPWARKPKHEKERAVCIINVEDYLAQGGQVSMVSTRKERFTH